jgi:hypothetical protein
MGPLEKKAFPKLVEMLEAYRAGSNDALGDGTQIAAGNNPGWDAEAQREFDELVNSQSPLNTPIETDPPLVQNVPPIAQNNPSNPNPVNPGSGPRQFTPFGKRPENANPQPAAPIDISKLTPVDNIGRLYKNGEAIVKGLGNGRATILEVYKEGKLKVLPPGGKPGDEVLVDIADARPPGNSSYISKEFGPGTLIDPANPPAAGTKLLGFHAGRWFEVEFVEMRGTKPVIKWPGETGRNVATSNMVRVPPPEGIKPYDGKRYVPPTDEGLTPYEQRGVYAKGKQFYLKDGAASRKVAIVQLFQEQVTKVQDLETGEMIYAFSGELSNTP